MEITLETVYDKIQDLDRKIDESRIKTTQWVVGIFIGAVVIISAIAGVYTSALILLAK